MRDVHGLSFPSIGLVSALPQVFLLFVTMGAALLADRLRTRKRRPLSSRTVRRALTTLGLGLNALFFVALTPLRESATTAAIIFVLAYSLLGFPVGGGYGVNHLDIAPRAAGVKCTAGSNAWPSRVARLRLGAARRGWPRCLGVLSPRFCGWGRGSER